MQYKVDASEKLKNLMVQEEVEIYKLDIALFYVMLNNTALIAGA